MRRARILLLAAAVLAASPLPAAADTRTAAFAQVDPGVRAAALGGAFTAVGGQPTALYWNPATLHFQDGRSLEASYSSLYGIGLAKRTFLTLGFKTVYDEPRFEGRRVVVREDRSSGPAYALGIQSLFLDLDEDGYSEISLGGGAAWSVGPRLAMGISARALFVSSDLDDVSANGYDVGVGLAYALSGRERIGVSAPHLLSRVFWKFDSTERLPLSLAAGWSRQWAPGLLTSAEAEWREGEPGPYRLGVGVEWWTFPDRLALRAGFRRLIGGLEEINRPTFGAGVRFGTLSVDYAFRLEPDLLGDTHRLGILTQF